MDESENLNQLFLSFVKMSEVRPAWRKEDQLVKIIHKNSIVGVRVIVQWVRCLPWMSTWVWFPGTSCGSMSTSRSDI